MSDYAIGDLLKDIDYEDEFFFIVDIVFETGNSYILMDTSDPSRVIHVPRKSLELWYKKIA